MDKHAVDRLAASVRAHPAWSSLTFTIVLCALVAVLLSLARGDTLEPEILVMSYSIGLSIHVCMYVGFVWWAPRLPPPVVAVAMLGCGLVLGMAVGGTLTEGRPLLLLRNGQALAIGAVLGALTIGGSCMMESWWDTRARLDHLGDANKCLLFMRKGLRCSSRITRRKSWCPEGWIRGGSGVDQGRNKVAIVR